MTWLDDKSSAASFEAISGRQKCTTAPRILAFARINDNGTSRLRSFQPRWKLQVKLSCRRSFTQLRAPLLHPLLSFFLPFLAG